jgi:hypothetical protein
VLPENCFGVAGERAGLRTEYEKQRAKTIIRLHDGGLALIRNREGVYLTADRYAGAEVEATNRVADIPRHRPEIDNDGSDYESKYGWVRNTF